MPLNLYVWVHECRLFAILSQSSESFGHLRLIIAYNAYGSESICLIACLLALETRKPKSQQITFQKSIAHLEKSLFPMCIMYRTNARIFFIFKWKRKIVNVHKVEEKIVCTVTVTVGPTRANGRWLIKHKSWLEISLYNFLVCPQSKTDAPGVSSPI